MKARFASGDQARIDAAFTAGDANRRVPQRLTEAHMLAALQATNGIDILGGRISSSGSLTLQGDHRSTLLSLERMFAVVAVIKGGTIHVGERAVIGAIRGDSKAQSP